MLFDDILSTTERDCGFLRWFANYMEVCHFFGAFYSHFWGSEKKKKNCSAKTEFQTGH
jgi:hypothetical protein